MCVQNFTGSQIIYNKLIQKNVKDVFIYTGGAIMSLINQFYKSENINYYIRTLFVSINIILIIILILTNKVLVTPQLDMQNQPENLELLL